MTDHITLPRSVVELILEGLLRPDFEATLRAALAGAAQAQQLPVGEVKVMGSYGGKPALGCLLTLEAESRMKPGDKLYTAPQPAQPVAVPHGWKLVPESALRWLFGEEGEFDCPPEKYHRGTVPPYWWRSVFRAMLAAAPTPPAATVPVLEPLTEREVELIDGMIEVQLHHAKQCDGIANRTMAEKQKGWDMERVELLRKLKAAHNAKLAKRDVA